MHATNITVAGYLIRRICNTVYFCQDLGDCGALNKNCFTDSLTEPLLRQSLCIRCTQLQESAVLIFVCCILSMTFPLFVEGSHLHICEAIGANCKGLAEFAIFVFASGHVKEPV